MNITNFNKPTTALLLLGFYCASACLADDNGGGVRVEVTAAIAVAQEANPPPAEEPKKPGEEEAAKQEAAAEKRGEEEAAQPEAVGKLNIRKGTGRPAGMPAAAPRAGAIIEDTRIDFVPELGGVGLNPKQPPAQDPQLEEQVATMRKQIEPQLRGILHAEVYFVHLVCNTQAGERQQVLAAAEPELEKVARTVAHKLVDIRGGNANDNFVRVRQGNMAMAVQGGATTNAEIDPTEMLRESLMRVVTEQLGEERSAALRQEMQQRVEAQRRAVISNLITLLDTFLVLSPQQQEDMIQQMLTGWRDQWQTIPKQTHAQYLPEMDLPPAALRVLSADQQARLRSIPRIHYGHQQNQQLTRLLNQAQDADRWTKALEQLDRAEQEGEKSQ